MPPRRPQKPKAPPADVAEAAARITQGAVKLYDRQDGQGVDWRVIGEALFRAAFDVLDKLPDDQRDALACRVHTGSYERFLSAAKEEDPSSKTAAADPVPSPSNTFAAKSPRPRPPK